MAIPETGPRLLDDDARLAYETAVSLAIYEGELIWARFNAMLLVNSIIAGAIGFVVNDRQGQTLGSISFGLTIVGMVLCIFWTCLITRGFRFYRYWIFSARELESRTNPALKILSRLSDFSSGQPVKFNLDGQEHILRMDWSARLMTAQQVSLATVAIFFIMYLFAFFLAILR